MKMAYEKISASAYTSIDRGTHRGTLVKKCSCFALIYKDNFFEFN